MWTALETRISCCYGFWKEATTGSTYWIYLAPLQPLRSTVKALPSARNIEDDELLSFLKQDQIQSFDHLFESINTIELCTRILSFKTYTGVMLQSIDYLEDTSVSRFNLKISSDFTYEAYHYGIRCTITSLSRNRIHYLNKWSKETIRYRRVVLFRSVLFPIFRYKV